MCVLNDYPQVVRGDAANTVRQPLQSALVGSELRKSTQVVAAKNGGGDFPD